MSINTGTYVVKRKIVTINEKYCLHFSTIVVYNLFMEEIYMFDNTDVQSFRESIRILVRKLGVLDESELSCCGISLAQCHALVEIGRSKGISLNRLAVLLNLENSTMSRTVNNLVTNNLVKREIGKIDRRYITLTLTPSGQELFESTEAGMNEYYSSILAKLPADKYVQIMESLSLLSDAADRSREINTVRCSSQNNAAKEKTGFQIDE